MNNRTLYLECYSGISGDMTVAALLDLGASETVLRETLQKLNLGGYEIEIGRVRKCGIDACSFSVELEEHHHSNHTHRNYRDIVSILEQAELNPNVRKLTKDIFEVVAKAEGKVHGHPMEEVHFHEVGAVDSIVDIVGVAVCLDNLKIDQVVISNLHEGCGHVRCQHGILPVPVPAVAQMIADYSLPVTITGQQGEMITPTGAAIVAALSSGKAPRSFQVKKLGVGAGKKDFERANILRAMLIEAEEDDGVWVLESNIDDCSGEVMGYAMECLLEAGARDVYFTPIFMKKNRPAYKISIICDELQIRELEQILFRETTTIGVRRYQAKRDILNRRIMEVDMAEEKARVKVCELNGSELYYPEYESVKDLCKKSGVSYKEMYQKIIRAIT